MDIKVSKPEILPDGFVGHIVFLEEPEGVCGICWEHGIFVFTNTLEQGRRKMAECIQSFLEEAIARDVEQARVDEPPREARRDIKRSRPFATYLVKSTGGRSKKYISTLPVYSAGVISTVSKKQAA